MARRNTRIICTLGPASRDESVIRGMMEEGMDFARLNFSHGSHDFHREMVEKVRRASQYVGKRVYLLQDLEGPKIRLTSPEEKRELQRGEEVILGEDGDGDGIKFSYPEVIDKIKRGDYLFMDDGVVELEVIENGPQWIKCRVLIGGVVQKGVGVNLPGVEIDLPPLSQKDMEDLDFGRGIGFDFIDQSMVRSRADVAALKSYMGGDVKVLAKIEDAKAVDNIEDVAEEVFGMVVARGDLGVSIPRARVPIVQKDIIALCRRMGRFVVVATEMLLSMVENHRPTRAEVADVANAVLEGCNAVMLSEETAIGRDPVTVVREMRDIIETVESFRYYTHSPFRLS